MKPYNSVQITCISKEYLKSHNYVQIICLKNSDLKL